MAALMTVKCPSKATEGPLKGQQANSAMGSQAENEGNQKTEASDTFRAKNRESETKRELPADTEVLQMAYLFHKRVFLSVSDRKQTAAAVGSSRGSENASIAQRRCCVRSLASVLTSRSVSLKLCFSLSILSKK